LWANAKKGVVLCLHLVHRAVFTGQTAEFAVCLFCCAAIRRVRLAAGCVAAQRPYFQKFDTNIKNTIKYGMNDFGFVVFLIIICFYVCTPKFQKKVLWYED
jgi:hypothetical protein